MKKLDEQINLPDGRILGYAETGQPDGLPVIFFHGQPGNRLFLPDEEITAQMGIRLITPDRPGYGLSTYLENRKITDWPADIAALVDHLDIPQFGLIGYSAGGPYALACAAAIPDKLTKVVLISGAPPMTDKALRKSMPGLIRLNYFLTHHFPRLFDWIFKTYWVSARKNPHNFLVLARKQAPPADKAIMDVSENAEMFLQTWQENLRRSHRGYTEDAILLMYDWGFDLRRIEKEVLLWWGEKDLNNPITTLNFFEKNLPNFHTYFHPNEGHFNFLAKWKIVLELFKLNNSG